jgi:hypothetical protein
MAERRCDSGIMSVWIPEYIPFYYPYYNQSGFHVVGLYYLVDWRWASNSMGLKLSSHLALGMSYSVQTSRHDSISPSEGAELDV